MGGIILGKETISKEKPKYRSHLRRKKLAHIIAKDRITTATDALVKAGYSYQTARTKQKQIIESEEVQNELRKIGYTEFNAKSRIASIINAPLKIEDVTPDNHLRASELVLRSFGLLNSEGGNKTLNINVFSPEQAQYIAQRLVSGVKQNDENATENEK